MSQTYTGSDVLAAIASASAQLTERKEEINRLNVFPVPDGDTGTNMSLTLKSVVDNIAKLPANAGVAEVRRAITTGALMGARGNSGVITSQILRGLCEGCAEAEEVSTATIDAAFSRAVEVAFQAVRKPVEGTILTVVKDMAAAAKHARKKKLSVDEALEAIVEEGYASVKRTPDLLPVLKENGVVDAGGEGFVLVMDAMLGYLQGRTAAPVTSAAPAAAQAPKEGADFSEFDTGEITFGYCTEFIVARENSKSPELLRSFLKNLGDCVVVVDDDEIIKVHVHTNVPGEVLTEALTYGPLQTVKIENMRNQHTALSGKETEAEAAAKAEAEPEVAKPEKQFGVVAVSAGEGMANLFRELGVDRVVTGGQTMNPSTKDLLDAAGSVNADAVIILPNNSNIIMAANSAAELSETPCAVVPTKSVPQAFSALFAVDVDASLETNVEEMTEAAQAVKTGEVTWATRDSKDAEGNPIAEGDVIGIADGSIEAVDDSIDGAVLTLLGKMDAEDADTCTILAGEGYSDEDLEALVAKIEEAYDELEVDAQRGEQPLYPIVFSVE